MKVNDLYGLDEALSELSNKELDISTGLKIKRNLIKVADELKPINEIRNDLIKKYQGEKSEGDRVEIKPDKLQEFNVKYNDLMTQDVKVEFDKIKLSELDGIKIKPKILVALDGILEDGESDE